MVRGLFFFKNPSTYYIMAVLWLVVGYFLSQGSVKADPVNESDLLQINGQLHSCSFLHSDEVRPSVNNHVLEINNHYNFFKVKRPFSKALLLEDFQKEVKIGDPVQFFIKHEDSDKLDLGKNISVYALQSKGKFYLTLSDVQYEERYSKYVKKPALALVFLFLFVSFIWLGILRGRYEKDRWRNA